MRRLLSTGMMALFVAGMAWGDPGDLTSDRNPGGDDAQPVVLSDVAKAPACNVKGGICLTAGAHTVAVSSEPLVAAGSKLPANAPVVPRFSRAAAVASGETAAAHDESAPWVIDMSASLKRPAWNGNALFIFFDLEDPDALENRQFTALYQTNIKSGPKLAAHLLLSPEDGFRPSHSYRLRIIQLIGGKEILLAEGDVSLL